jgi:hypothetical protein
MTEQGNPTFVRHLASFWMISLATRWVMSRQIYLEGGCQHPKKMESENQKSNHGFHPNLRGDGGHLEVTALVSVLGLQGSFKLLAAKASVTAWKSNFV